MGAKQIRTNWAIGRLKENRHSFKSIAEDIGVTRERVQQIARRFLTAEEYAKAWIADSDSRFAQRQSLADLIANRKRREERRAEG